MKIVTLLILLFLTGCDDTPDYTPTDLGYGHAFVFSGSSWGNSSVMDKQLNAFLKKHPEFKVKSITKIDDNSEKRLVIMDRVLPEITQ